jgi:opacity protein-like surface antigen
MKRNILITAASAVVLTASSLAGETSVVSTKNVVAPAPPPVYYGTGFYLGLEAGINAYQDFGSKEFSIRGNDVKIDSNQKIGGVGGLKAGYVFGTGTVRPAIEADLFYNGVKADLDARVNGNKTKFNAQGDLNSGAFMGNFLVRFAFDRFQPYVGAGAGGWVAEANDLEVTIAGKTHDFGSSNSNSGFAWQVIGGADYYFTEKFSAFLEYKFLNYEDAGISGDNLAQQIVVLGLRWHF